MKRVLLTGICIVCICLTSRAQNVANTFWLGYDTTDTPDLYWHFTSDSLYFSTDNVNWQIVSTFTENASLLNITDVPTPPPYCGGTGIYTKSFSGDTLWLTIVNDTCSSRVDYITTHYFVNTLTGIDDPNPNLVFTISPNPTDGIFNVKSAITPEKISVADISGRIILEVCNTSNTSTLDLTTFPPGIYFVRVYSGENSSVQRIILK